MLWTAGKSASALANVRQLLGDSIQQWLKRWELRTLDLPILMKILCCSWMAARSLPQRIKVAALALASSSHFMLRCWRYRLHEAGTAPDGCFFDAPKQHELSQTDFDSYTDKLALLAAKYPQRVQVVFSFADLKTQFQAGDEVWIPSVTFDGNARFLGSIDQKPERAELGV